MRRCASWSFRRLWYCRGERLVTALKCRWKVEGAMWARSAISSIDMLAVTFALIHSIACPMRLLCESCVKAAARAGPCGPRSARKWISRSSIGAITSISFGRSRSCKSRRKTSRRSGSERSSPIACRFVQREPRRTRGMSSRITSSSSAIETAMKGCSFVAPTTCHIAGMSTRV